MTYRPEFLTLVVLVAGVLSSPAALAGDDGGSSGGPTVNSAGYKVIGWNDLGMHCMDGKDYSVFAVLPPYNTIHAHLIDPNGKLITSGAGYTVSYQAAVDPLTNSINTTSALKTNFWQYAGKLGFGFLAPDTGLKGFRMPGTGSVPMAFSAADNTFLAEGIPVTPWADAPTEPYPTNYFPMMRLVAKSSSGAVLASTDIVLPVSDEMTCKVCHASAAATSAAMPSGGWVNNPDPAKDTKLNILRKHDDRFKTTALYQTAATAVGYSTAGLEATVASTPVLCDKCHASNALGTSGITGVEPLTTAMHGLHANAVDPVSNLTLENWTTRDSCYRCHPGPNTQCLRGAMGSLKNASGSYAMECQSCHGSMNTLAVATRKGWLDEPTCQSCHSGTATSNSGQIVYTSVFSGGTNVRSAANLTFATNANTPAAGLSLYRFSKGHGGLQCEACHGSTHAEYATPIVNDNVQSNSLQGHVGMISECTSCHPSSPSTYNGGPHGLHPLGQSWVNGHESAVSSLGAAACQACHGQDYKGTLLSKAQANRSFSTEWGTKTFARGTLVGCYSCHNGPNP